MKNTPAVPVVATIFALPGAAVARPVQRVVYSVADTSIVPVAVCWRTEALSLSRRQALHPQGDPEVRLIHALDRPGELGGNPQATSG